MTSRIVVPLDGLAQHELATKVGLSLGARLGVDVELMSVVSPKMEDVDESELQEIAEEVGATRAVCVPGEDVAPALLAEVDRDGALLCMASSGKSALSEAFLGSVSGECIRTAERPLVVVGPHCRTEFAGTRLAVALDGSHRAEAIITFAAELAKELALELWLYEVIEPAAAAQVSGVESGYVHRAALKAGLGTEVNYEVLHHEHPDKGLIELTRDPDVAVLAMTTRGETARERLFHGSVAVRVVHHAERPVYLLHPQED